MSGRKRNEKEYATPELAFAMEHSRNEGCYPDVFTEEVMQDAIKAFHLEEHPNYYVKLGGWMPKLDKDKKPVVVDGEIVMRRRLRLEIMSFCGISIGAIHYYGKIYADGLDITDGKSHIGGHVCKEFSEWPHEKKDIYDNYTIEVVRELTQEEIDKDPERWRYYFPGDKTNGFETKEEIIEIAKKIVAVRFPEGWEPLEIEINC